jgi:hypothetical protein
MDGLAEERAGHSRRAFTPQHHRNEKATDAAVL